MYFIMRIAVVQRILAKGPLSLENHEFKISQMRPAPPSPLPRGPIDQSAILVRHFTPRCSTEELARFLQTNGRCSVESATYGLLPGVAMVRFDDAPGKFIGEFENLHFSS